MRITIIWRWNQCRRLRRRGAMHSVIDVLSVRLLLIWSLLGHIHNKWVSYNIYLHLVGVDSGPQTHQSLYIYVASSTFIIIFVVVVCWFRFQIVYLKMMPSRHFLSSISTSRNIVQSIFKYPIFFFLRPVQKIIIYSHKQPEVP